MHCNWTCTHKNSQLGRHFSEISVYIKYCQIRHTQKRDFTNTKITDWDLTLKYSIIFDCDPNTQIFYKYCLLTQIEIVYNLILHPTLRYSTIIALDFTLSYSAILDWDPTFKYPKIIGWNQGFELFEFRKIESNSDFLVEIKFDFNQNFIRIIRI